MSEDPVEYKADDEEKESAKVFIDRSCYVAPYKYGWRLGYIHVSETLKEVEKTAGYYIKLEHALQAYKEKVLRGSEVKNIDQLLDLLKKIDETIKLASAVIIDKLNAALEPEVDPTLGIAKKKRRKIKR